MTAVRPASSQDFLALGEALPMTARAIAVEVDGKLVAVGGFYLREGSTIIFARIDEAHRKSPGFGRRLLRCARAVMKDAIDMGLPIAAAADQDIPGADRLLERLGFKQAYKEVYQWHGQR